MVQSNSRHSVASSKSDLCYNTIHPQSEHVFLFTGSGIEQPWTTHRFDGIVELTDLGLQGSLRQHEHPIFCTRTVTAPTSSKMCWSCLLTFLDKAFRASLSRTLSKFHFRISVSDSHRHLSWYRFLHCSHLSIPLITFKSFTSPYSTLKPYPSFRSSSPKSWSTYPLLKSPSCWLSRRLQPSTPMSSKGLSFPDQALRRSSRPSNQVQSGPS